MNVWGYASVKRWAGRLSDSTAQMNVYLFENFMNWASKGQGKFAKFSPDDMVEHQRGAGNGAQFDILDVVQDYVGSFDRNRQGYKIKIYSSIRSFFMHNRAELPRDPGFMIRGDVAKVQGTLTVKEIREIVLSSNPTYRAIFLSMLQGGLGQEELHYWNMNGLASLQEQLKGDPELVRIDLPGRKKQRNLKPYFTFIGSDAINAVNEWMKIRPDTGASIFVGQFGTPIDKKSIEAYWRRKLFTLRLVEKKEAKNSGNRYGKNLHEIRDVFRTQWEKSPGKNVAAEYFMGHEVDPLEYNKAYTDEEWAREQYEEGLPYLQIMTGNEPYRLTDAKKVKDLEEEVEKLREGQGGKIDELTRALQEKDLIMSEVLKRLEYLEKRG